jgi:hypothetical protein
LYNLALIGIPASKREQLISAGMLSAVEAALLDFQAQTAFPNSRYVPEK